MQTKILAAALTLSLAGPAFADTDKAPRITPSAPSAISDVLAAGGGTVTGAVVRADSRGFTIADASGEAQVKAKGRDLTELTGRQVTVTGRAENGRIKARHIVLDDGALVMSKDHGADNRHDD